MNRNNQEEQLGDRLLDLHLGELTEADRQELEAQIASSPQLARRLDLEVRLHAALKSRLSRIPAPPGLETRIRATLDGGDAPSVTRANRPSADSLVWYRRPWVAALGAVAMFAAILWASADDLRSLWSAPDTVVVVAQVVTVVDQECDRMGRTYSQQKLCTDPTHLNALRQSTGDYWQISTAIPAHRRLIVDRELRGHQLAVAGRLYPPIGTLEIQTFEDLGAAVETAALRRH